jgi:hypothetical protein
MAGFNSEASYARALEKLEKSFAWEVRILLLLPVGVAIFLLNITNSAVVIVGVVVVVAYTVADAIFSYVATVSHPPLHP